MLHTKTLPLIVLDKTQRKIPQLPGPVIYQTSTDNRIAKLKGANTTEPRQIIDKLNALVEQEVPSVHYNLIRE
jgi:hypothetical protein